MFDLSRKISGIQFKDAVISGAANITSKCREVNELNVFPVPDGDTGTNMSMTINAASRHLKNSKSTGVLVEYGFLSNKSDREKLLNEKYLYKLALIIKDSIIEYLSL